MSCMCHDATYTTTMESTVFCFFIKKVMEYNLKNFDILSTKKRNWLFPISKFEFWYYGIISIIRSLKLKNLLEKQCSDIKEGNQQPQTYCTWRTFKTDINVQSYREGCSHLTYTQVGLWVWDKYNSFKVYNHFHSNTDLNFPQDLELLWYTHSV